MQIAGANGFGANVGAGGTFGCLACGRANKWLSQQTFKVHLKKGADCAVEKPKPGVELVPALGTAMDEKVRLNLRCIQFHGSKKSTHATGMGRPSSGNATPLGRGRGRGRERARGQAEDEHYEDRMQADEEDDESGEEDIGTPATPVADPICS